MAQVETPRHGIGERSVDWDRFYSFLESCLVPIPVPAEGAPVDLLGIVRTLAMLQNSRAEVERAAMLVERRHGECARRVSILKETHRLSVGENLQDTDVVKMPRGERRLAAEAMAGGTAAGLAENRAELELWSSARSAIRGQLVTMERAKETLNAMRQIATTGPGSDGDSGWAPVKQRPREHRSW